MTPATCQYCGAARTDFYDFWWHEISVFACQTVASFNPFTKRWCVRMALQCARKGREG